MTQIPDKVTERTNSNEHKENVVSVEKVFVLVHAKCCNVEDYRVETLAEEDKQADIKGKNIPLGCSTNCG